MAYLTERERYLIEFMYNKEHKTQREIAKILNKHYNTIYNEIKRGKTIQQNSDLTFKEIYLADVSQRKYLYNATSKGAKLKISNDYDFANFVEEKIKEKYSFYSILILAKHRNFNTDVCLTTMYNYFKQGIFNITKKDMPYNKIKKVKQEKQPKKVYQFGKRSIEERKINKRYDYGNWEMDTVQGKRKTKSCILVLTERKSRQELLFKLDNKLCSSVWSTLEKHWDILHKYINTITCDNGVEFSTNYEFKNEQLKKFVQTNLYYCHPYRSGERGSNENNNKLIRRFIPKGIDIKPFTQEYLLKVQDFINNMPRKLLNGLSSNQFLEMYESEYLRT